MKLKLDTEWMAEDFFEGTRLLGIVAPVKQYQICWKFNQLFRFNFRINNDLEIQLTRKHRQYFFPVYEYAEPSCALRHYLYNNQHDGEYLLPEFKHLDFMWLMKGDHVEPAVIVEMIHSIRTVHPVQLVVELTNEKIKNKGHLIF